MGLIRIRWVAGALVLAFLVVSAASRAETDPVPVILETDLGTIRLELYPDKAPATVANFLSYVDRYFYDGVIFHRVVDDFVIQSGAYRFDLTYKEPGEPVVNESGNGLKNKKGTVAMARHSDPDSARAQFYINLSDNPNLDADGDNPGYTVFGKVVAGMDVVQAIGDVPVRDTADLVNVPETPVRILKARREQQP